MPLAADFRIHVGVSFGGDRVVRTRGIHVRYFDRGYGIPGIVNVAFTLCSKENGREKGAPLSNRSDHNSSLQKDSPTHWLDLSTYAKLPNMNTPSLVYVTVRFGHVLS